MLRISLSPTRPAGWRSCPIASQTGAASTAAWLTRSTDHDDNAGARTEAMTSLTKHLREEGDHGRLGFHPSCPVCCSDRLAGRLPGDAIVTARMQALLAAGAL